VVRSVNSDFKDVVRNVIQPSLVQKPVICKTHDRRTIKSADFIARFYQPIFTAKLEPSSTAKFIADNIGRIKSVV